jgi:RNA polymerase sigma-70 factor (ECF subfamily)
MGVSPIIAGQTDHELVRCIQLGERDAFGELVRRYQDKIYTVCVRWLGNPALAEEIAQDTFVAAYRAMDRFRGESKLSTWLYSIAVNHCKTRTDHDRRRARDRHESLSDDAEDGRTLTSKGPETDRKTHRSEAMRLLQTGLDELEPPFRTVVVLRDIQDLSYPEIAELLNLPLGTVKSRIHRARLDLARALAGRITPEDILD